MFKGVEPMGRGRAKAKQVKVARQLKYNSGGTDLDRLRTELGVGEGGQGNNDHASSDLADRYSDFDEHDGEEDEAAHAAPWPSGHLRHSPQCRPGGRAPDPRNSRARSPARVPAFPGCGFPSHWHG